MTLRRTAANLLLAALVLAVYAGCSHVPNALDPEHAPKGSGWKCLFNGKDLTGWHRRADHDRPLSWKVEDGLLTNALEPGQHGTDLVTDEKFRNFEIYYEYRVPKSSNSGMYLRGLYEVQILEDGGAEPGPGTNGGIWATAAPRINASKPAGEWQSSYVKICGQQVKLVVLNGETIHENVELTRPTGGDLRDQIGMDEPGPIMIQGDHGEIQLRNIWIREIQRCGHCCGNDPDCKGKCEK